MKKKLSLTNLERSELTKSEMGKTIAGHICSAICSCYCGTMFVADANNAGLGKPLAELSHNILP